MTLHNLKNDVGETVNLADEHPEVVERLLELVDIPQKDLADGSREIEGMGVRLMPHQRDQRQ